MIPARPGSLLLLLLLPSLVAEDHRDRILLLGGDRLSGRLVEAAPEEGVRWRHHADHPPVLFRYPAVGSIELEERNEEAPWEPRQGLLRFSNGDEIEGVLVAMTETGASLRTGDGSTLDFPRDRCQWMVFDRKPTPSLYSGPEGLAGWTRGDVSIDDLDSGHFEYTRGHFHAAKAASIARDLQLPDRARIEFVMHWRGIPNLALALYTDSLQPINLGDLAGEPAFKSFYSVQFLHNYANILVIEQDAPLQRLGLGQIQVPAFRNERSAHIDLRIDKSRASISLLVDGDLIKTWTDPKGFTAGGTGIRLVHQGGGSALAIGRLRLSPWDGEIGTPPTLRSMAEDDLVTLHDRQHLPGRVLSLRDGVLLLDRGEEAPHGIPLEEVARIEFAGVADPGVPEPSGARVLVGHLARRGSVRLELSRIGEGRLQGTSPNFGAVDLPVRSFKLLEFNPR